MDDSGRVDDEKKKHVQMERVAKKQKNESWLEVVDVI